MTKLARLATLMRQDPSYVLGRFESVRRAYALGQSLIRGSGADLEIVNLYRRHGDRIERQPSGLVQSDHAAAEHLARLDRTSWSDGIRLTPEAVEALRAFALDSPISYWRDAKVTQIYADSIATVSPAERAGLTTATLEDAWKNPTVRAIAGDPLITEVIEGHLGYAPRRVMVYMFWSFVADLSHEERVARTQTIEYHYDIQGYNFTYVSFYLYPTDRANGAHALVEGSHRGKKLSHLLGGARMSDAEAEAHYGAERIKLIEADAGEGFFEDTSCYHKATPPEARERLLFQLRYL